MVKNFIPFTSEIQNSSTNRYTSIIKLDGVAIQCRHMTQAPLQPLNWPKYKVN